MKKLHKAIILALGMALPMGAMAASDAEVTIRVMEMNEASSEQVMEHIKLPEMLDEKAHDSAEHGPDHIDKEHADEDHSGKNEHENEMEENDQEHDRQLDMGDDDEHGGSDVNDRVNEHREEHDERGEEGPEGPDDMDDNDGPEHSSGPQNGGPNS